MENNNVGLHLDIYRQFVFQTGNDGREHEALHLDVSLDDFDLHSWSQLYDISKTSVFIISEILPMILMKISVATPCWKIETYAKLLYK